MEALDALQAVAAIQVLKGRYARLLDTQDWDGFEAVFAADLVADMRDATGQRDETMLTHGAAAFVAGLAPLLAGVRTVHHCHTPEIEIATADTATGIWAMEDKLWPGPDATLPYTFMHGYGHYHERYTKVSGAWRIAEIRLSRLHVETA